MTTQKLSKTQQELYDAMKAGVVVRHIPSFGGYSFGGSFVRNDKPPGECKCTAAAISLLNKGVCEKFNLNQPRSGCYQLRIKEQA